jgi:hypothetical protein
VLTATAVPLTPSSPQGLDPPNHDVFSDVTPMIAEGFRYSASAQCAVTL